MLCVYLIWNVKDYLHLASIEPRKDKKNDVIDGIVNVMTFPIQNKFNEYLNSYALFFLQIKTNTSNAWGSIQFDFFQWLNFVDSWTES